MLVFYKYKLGSTIIDGKRIYGYMEKYPPVQVSWDTYRANAGNLIQATYTQERLQALFPDGVFPNVSFIYSDIRYLTYDQMCALCRGFGISGGNRKNEKRRKSLRAFLKEKC
jgi:hypothetical protein